jgi:DNA replicative helicase MCM subunit Mcm2 (Cdc46/Mcm family)
MDYLVEFMSNVAQTKNIPTENKETQYSDVKELIGQVIHIIVQKIKQLNFSSKLKKKIKKMVQHREIIEELRIIIIPIVLFSFLISHHHHP